MGARGWEEDEKEEEEETRRQTQTRSELSRSRCYLSFSLDCTHDEQPKNGEKTLVSLVFRCSLNLEDLCLVFVLALFRLYS